MKKEHEPYCEMCGTIDADNMTPMERLLALRDFLRTPIPNELWDFQRPDLDIRCGSAGCACGWYDHLAATGRQTWLGAALVDMETNPFGLSVPEFHRCFTPSASSVYGVLPPSASPRDVADEIDRILADREKGKAK